MATGTVPPRAPGASSLHRHGRSTAVWRRWVAVTTAGELMGFLVPALVAALARGALDGPTGWALMVPAGAGEGAVLGWAQSRVLRRELAGLDTGDWVLRTAAAAALAWAIGMAPSSSGDALDAHGARGPVVQAVVLVPAGVLVLVSIGAAQWTVLRRHVPGALRWVGWTALAWLIALGVFVAVTTPLWQPGQGSVLVTGIAALGGSLMAGTMAAVTGWGLVRLLRSVPPPTTTAAPGESGGPAPGEASGQQVAGARRIDPAVGPHA